MSTATLVLNSVATVLIIGGAVYGMFRGFKKWVQAQVVVPAETAVAVAKGVSEQVTRVESQVHSNHGTSMADDITKIDSKVTSLDSKVDILGVRLNDHLHIRHFETNEEAG